jgi:hypothetical protein
MFMNGSNGTLAACIDMAADMIANGETGCMLVGTIEQDEAMYLVIGREQKSCSLCSSAEARTIVTSTQDIPEILRQLSILKSRKGIA